MALARAASAVSIDNLQSIFGALFSNCYSWMMQTKRRKI
jgi:hypothetical protein